MEQRRPFPIVWGRRFDAQPEHGSGLKARIDLQQFIQAVEKEAGRGQQDDRGHGLKDHQKAPADLVAVAPRARQTGAPLP
jgi:hypothetical protein